MIELLIFHLHIIGVLYAFTKNWQTRNLKYAALSVIIIGLIFSIGWSLTYPIACLIYPYEWKTMYFSQDTMSLVLLFIPECFFFYSFFIKDKANQISK